MVYRRKSSRSVRTGSNSYHFDFNLSLPEKTELFLLKETGPYGAGICEPNT